MKVKDGLFQCSVLFIFMVSCGEYQKIMKSEDYKMKFEAGMKYYSQGKCDKAYQLLEDCIPYYRGKEEYREIIFALADCDMRDGNYETARERYKYLSSLYAGTTVEEKALFYTVVCDYLLSNDYDLDSKNSIEAMSSASIFMIKFPNSPYADSVKKIRNKLFDRKFRKEAEIAYLYYNMEDYKASKASFMNLLEKYQNTYFGESEYFYLLSSAFLLAKNSSVEKQYERYREFLDLFSLYHNFIKNKEYRSQLKEYYNFAVEEIKKHDKR